ncbi:hypothetical protein KR093_009654 [Drosophila rubida]|uniref:Secreted protein n=1 Tax=Drosophila rubida TaxID=30044 RepID=A0AAD4K1N1_9MUSC|nr:hypothetical protein KR093_009654 [Drosophila rubida]
MRTLIVLTFLVCWGSIFVATSNEMEEDNDLEVENKHIKDHDNDHEYNDDDAIDETKPNDSQDYDYDKEADEEPKEDYIDDTSDSNVSTKVTTPYNFLRYPEQPKYIPKYPRFAILRRKMLHFSDVTF